MRDRHFARYAVYWAPEPDSALSRFGCGWLGYDAATGANSPPPDGLGRLPRPRERLVEIPRRYGFHATVRAPFRPAEGIGRAALEQALAAFCAAMPPIPSLLLSLDTELGFVALRPAVPCPALDRLAAAVVRQFQPLARAPDEAEFARRRGAGLSREADANLLRWGYPWVMELFRFHLTLTGPLPPSEAAEVVAALAPAAEPVLRHPTEIRSLALFGDPGGGQPFRMLARYPLGTSA